MDRMKTLFIKAGYIISGLILASIPQKLEQTAFILNLEHGTFLSGLASGVFLALRIIGICLFAYGIVHFTERAEKKKQDE